MTSFTLLATGSDNGALNSNLKMMVSREGWSATGLGKSCPSSV